MSAIENRSPPSMLAERIQACTMGRMVHVNIPRRLNTVLYSMPGRSAILSCTMRCLCWLKRSHNHKRSLHIIQCPLCYLSQVAVFSADLCKGTHPQRISLPPCCCFKVTQCTGWLTVKISQQARRGTSIHISCRLTLLDEILRHSSSRAQLDTLDRTASCGMHAAISGFVQRPTGCLLWPTMTS